MAKRNWRWVSLDPYPENSNYFNGKAFGVRVWSGNKPPVLEFDKDKGFKTYRSGTSTASGGHDAVLYVCLYEFHQMFGVAPKPGERLKMRFTGEVKDG